MTLNDVPVQGQTLNSSRPLINANFSTIDAAFLVDHVPYNIAGQGRHNRVSFPIQNPVPAPEASIVQLYSQLSSFTNQPELAYARQAGSTAPSALQTVEFTSAGWNAAGWTRLPSGILLKWTTALGFGGQSFIDINVNTIVPGSPNFTTLFSEQITTLDSAASYNNVIGVSNYNAGTKVLRVSCFRGTVPPNTVSIALLLIGY